PLLQLLLLLLMFLFELFQLPLLTFLHLLLVPVVRRRTWRIFVPLVARIIRLLVPWIVVWRISGSVVPLVPLICVSLFNLLLLFCLLLFDFLAFSILLLTKLVEFLLVPLFELRIHIRARSWRTVVVAVLIALIAAIISTVVGASIIYVVIRDRRRAVL